MTFKDYQKLLNKEISKLNETFIKRFEKHHANGFVIFNSKTTNLDLYGVSVQETRIVVRSDTINSIIFYFDEIITKTFYEKFTRDYGLPQKINVIDEIEIISSNLNDDAPNEKDLEKRFLSIKDGSFEDKPLSIVWRKGEFVMTLLFKYEEKTTQIRLEKESVN